MLRYYVMVKSVNIMNSCVIDMCWLCEAWYDEYPIIDSAFCLCCVNRDKCSDFQKARWNDDGDCLRFRYECPKVGA